jgi:hypothetical protein
MIEGNNKNFTEKTSTKPKASRPGKTEIHSLAEENQLSDFLPSKGLYLKIGNLINECTICMNC